jgi:hypothetical protein
MDELLDELRDGLAALAPRRRRCRASTVEAAAVDGSLDASQALACASPCCSATVGLVAADRPTVVS